MLGCDRIIELVTVNVDKCEASPFDDARVLSSVFSEMLNQFFVIRRVGNVPHVERLDCHFPFLARSSSRAVVNRSAILEAL